MIVQYTYLYMMACNTQNMERETHKHNSSSMVETERTIHILAPVEILIKHTL